MSESVAVAILIGSMGTVALLAIGWYVVGVVAYWRIFTKAGEAGWKSLIPFYNNYVQYKITWNTQMFWIGLIAIIVGTLLYNMDGFISIIGGIMCLAATVISWISLHKLSLAFGHGIGFTLGLLFLNPIFILILGLGSSEYQGNTY